LDPEEYRTVIAMNRRVVVTGIGCVTPHGSTRQAIWNHLTEGRSAVGPLTLFDASSYPVRIAAEVHDWDLSDVGLDAERWSNCPRQTLFAIGSALKAVRESGISESRHDPTRFGVYLGCGEPFEDFDRFAESICGSQPSGAYQPGQFFANAIRLFDPHSEVEFEPDMPAIHLAGMLNAQGPVLNAVSACVSSTQAIGESARMIRHGQADIMLCGGAHSLINQFGVTGFHRLSALSTRDCDPMEASRPFDLNRDGFVIGEGGAAFVVEELDHARRRNAEILGEITGYGSAQDAFRVTDSHPTGRGAARAVQTALKRAALNPEDIHYINAHGTGTVMNDKVETTALKHALGDAVYSIPVSSTKSVLGHATTACGAIETAVCLMALQSEVVPPTINYQTPDPDCDLDYVPNIARDVRCRHVLNNTVGFGGQNAALVISRFDNSRDSHGSLKRVASAVAVDLERSAHENELMDQSELNPEHFSIAISSTPLHVAVVGAGTMGKGIAEAVLRSGATVTVLDQSPRANDNAKRWLHQQSEQFCDNSRLRFALTEQWSSVADVDLVIETVSENPELKQQVLAEVEAHVSPTTVIATNTSSISLRRLSGALENTDRFCGLHFCHPIRERQLVEVIRGECTSTETIERTIGYAKRFGRLPLVVADSPGFVINRLLVSYLNEALALLLEGVAVPEIAAAAKRFGMPIGPFEQMDRMGIDVAVRAGTHQFFAFPDRVVPSALLVKVMKSKRLGMKTGSGFYEWSRGTRSNDIGPWVQQLIQDRIESHTEPSADALQMRLFLPMLLESRQMIHEGLVQNADAIDTALANGLGFQPLGIGLMTWANRIGWQQLEQHRLQLEYLGPRFANRISKAA
jgi:3-oxoacyl-[acyl-carrier-protein] synthase II